MVVSPELHDTGEIEIKGNDSLASGILEDSPPVFLNGDFKTRDFTIVENNGDRYAEIMLPTQAEGVFERAYCLIPPDKWELFPDPIKNEVY